MFEAWGKTKEELFEESAKALFDIMVELKSVKEKEKREMSIEEEFIEDLLYSWLNGLLFYVDAESLMFSRFKVKIKDNILRGKMYGEKICERHELKTEVKAITYHKLKVWEEKNKLFARVLVDI